MVRVSTHTKHRASIQAKAPRKISLTAREVNKNCLKRTHKIARTDSLHSPPRRSRIPPSAATRCVHFHPETQTTQHCINSFLPPKKAGKEDTRAPRISPSNKLAPSQSQSSATPLAISRPTLPRALFIPPFNYTARTTAAAAPSYLSLHESPKKRQWSCETFARKRRNE